MLPSLGGPLVVNGVVFFGGTMTESKLRAFSAIDGHLLWEYDLPSSGHSVPGTYLWKGRRYVVVSAGGHGKLNGSKLGDTVLAFTVD
jgi:quinoprotein glucose dehydrogenase